MATRMNQNPERRRAPRTDERISLAITGTDGVVQTETKNISASGAYCTINKFIAPMTKLEMQFDLPDGNKRTTIRCSGVVVRVEPVISSADRGLYNVAIFFNGLSEQNRQSISRFVQQRLAKNIPGSSAKP